jgi:hypothetical protein
MGLHSQAVHAMSKYMCSEALCELSTVFTLGFKAEVAVALHLRGRFLLNYLLHKVNPEMNRLTYFFRDLWGNASQRLVSRIFYEVWRANTRKDEILVEQFMTLLVDSFDALPGANDDLAMSKFKDPLCQLGLWHYFDGPKWGPVRNLVRLTEEYYTARWMPFFNCGSTPVERAVCVTNNFRNSSEYEFPQFAPPTIDYDYDLEEPVDDANYTSNEWLLAILRGMADATADRRYPEVLAMGFYVLYHYNESKKPYGLYRIEIWGYLALAVAALDLYSPDTAFYCVERMFECCRTLSDKSHCLATETRVRELLCLSTQITFDDAVQDHQMPKLSEQFVEIVFAHMRARFRRIEDLMLSFIREYLMHHDCQDMMVVCSAKRNEITKAVSDTLDQITKLVLDRDLWAYWHEHVVYRMRNYQLVFTMMEVMVDNMNRRENFSVAKLQSAAQKLSDFSDEQVDWPTFYVYAEMALPWVTNYDSLSFPTRLTNLCRKMETLVGYQNSRTEADAMTSALILYVFGRDLTSPDNAKHQRMTLPPYLVHRVQSLMEKVPVSITTAFDFRSSILISIKTLLFNDHLKHSRTKRREAFWCHWRMSDFCYVSALGFKNHVLVDREKIRLADFERAYFEKNLGAKMKPNRHNSNAHEVELSEKKRDLKLLHILRTGTNGLVDSARGYGWQRLDGKRRF